MIRSLELTSRPRATPSHHQVAGMALKRQRYLIVPPPIHHPSLWWGNQHPNCPETQYCLEIQVISTEDGGTTPPSPTCLAGTSCGRHGPRWQIWPNRSSSDWPRLGHPVLWTVVFRRRTELACKAWNATCSCCQEPSVELVNKPSSMPIQ